MKQPAMPRVSVNSKLMQEYRLARPVTADKEITTVLDKNGQVQVFSIGNNGSVYNVYRDPHSDTGWSIVDMKFKTKAKHIAAGKAKDGSLIVFVCGTDNNLYFIKDVRWNSWQNAGSKADESIDMIRLGNRPDGTLLASVLTNATAKPALYEIPWDSEEPHTWKKEAQISKYSTTVYDYQVGIDNGRWTGGNTVVYFLSVKYNADFRLYVFVPNDVPFHTRGTISAYSSSEQKLISAISLASPSLKGSKEKVSAPLLVINEKLWYYFPAHWGMATYSVNKDVRAHKIAAGQQLVHKTANGTTQNYNATEAFAITKEKKLYHFSALFGVDWSDGIEIVASRTFAQLSLTLDTEGNSQLFAVTTDSRLFHIWQDSDSTDWNVVEIEVPAAGDVEEFSSYNTEITVFHAEQVLGSGKAVKIFSEGPINLEINGSAVMIDKDAPWAGVTNMSGKVLISDKTNSLGTEALFLWTEDMPEKDRIALTASGPVEDKLGTMEGGNLMAAKVTANDGIETDLLKGNYRTTSVADSMAQALNKSMSLARRSQPDASAADAAYLHPNTDRRVAHYWPNYDGRSLQKIDHASVPEQHWHLDFSSGQPVFRSLSRDEAVTLMARRRNTIPNLGSIADLDVGWGDIWGAIEEGAASIVSDVADIVVSTVVDPITKVVTDITAQIIVAIEELGKKVNYLFEEKIDLVQQAFDIVEGAFSKIAVFFQDLYRWLGFIFNWNDILNTKAVLEYYINQMLDGLNVWTEQGLSDFIKQEFSSFRTQVTSALDNAEKTFAKGVSFDGMVPKEARVSADAGESPLYGAALRKTYAQNSNSSNYVWNQVCHEAEAGQSLTLALGTGTNVELQNLVTLIKDKLENDSVFNDSLKKFDKWFSSIDDPESFFDVAVLSLIEVVKDVIVAVLDIIESILLALVELISSGISAFKTLINTTINDMPLISALYRKIAHHDLTLLDVASLLVAVPTTILYKIIRNEAPFTAEDAKWATPTKSYTPPPFPWPGLTAEAKPMLVERIPDPLGDRFSIAHLKIVTFASGIVSMFYGFFDAGLDTGAWVLKHKPTDPNYEKEVEAFEGGPLLIALSVASILTSCFMQLGAYPQASFNRIDKGEDTPGDRLSIASWGTNFLPIVTDLLFTCFGKRKGLTKFQDGYGLYLSSFEGICMLAVGIGAVIVMQSDKKYDLSGWAAVETIVAPLPYVAESALLADSTYSLGLVLGLDILFGFAVGVCRIVPSSEE